MQSFRFRKVWLALTLTGLVVGGDARSARADDAEPFKSEIADVSSTDMRKSRVAVSKLQNALRAKGEKADEAAKAVLAAKGKFVSDEAALKAIEEIAGKSKASAAELLLKISGAQKTIKQYKKGHVIFGRVAVPDGKLEPRYVLAQMEILDDGYFAGEVGDLIKPVGFNAQGYDPVLLDLKGKSGEVIDVGQVTMKPLTAEHSSILKGKIKVDGGPKFGAPELSLNLSVGPINTPHNGYSPRRGWPKGMVIKAAEDGSFTKENLSPGNYYMTVSAKDHVPTNKMVKVAVGKEEDVGTIRLKHKDLGFYVGKKAPDSHELAWEKEFKDAKKKAHDENKPLMVMMTATWCGPCKMLEKESLNDPWVRHLLANFVVVKAFEDKEVNEEFGCSGYPTLAFLDSSGKMAFKTVGYKPALSFLEECLKATAKLKVKPPAEIQELIDKKVLGSD